MSTSTPAPTDIASLFGWLKPYADRARDRGNEYLNERQGDIDFNTRVLYEVIMGLAADNAELRKERAADSAELHRRLDKIDEVLGVTE